MRYSITVEIERIRIMVFNTFLQLTADIDETSLLEVCFETRCQIIRSLIF
ncbi:MAG: hypothetical protein ACUVV4_02550 [Candidatus Bathyarchaeia archaeon]